MKVIRQEIYKSVASLKWYLIYHFLAKRYAGKEKDLMSFIDRKNYYLIDVDLKRIRGLHEMGFPYISNGRHPYVSAIKELEERGGEIKYNKSILKKYYSKYQPNSAADLLDIDKRSESYEYLSKIKPQYSELPWRGVPGERKRSIENDAKEHGFDRISDEDGYDGYGPISNELGEMVLERLKTVWFSVKINKYKTKKSIKSLILLPLYNDLTNDYAFQVLSGHHRLAAAVVDGIPAVKCIVHGSSVIRRSEVDDWPAVKAEVLSRYEALNIFDRVVKGLPPQFMG